MDVSGKKVLVFGTGISGIAAARLLMEKQAEVILFDGNPETDRDRVLENLGTAEHAALYTGQLPQEVKAGLT